MDSRVVGYPEKYERAVKYVEAHKESLGGITDSEELLSKHLIFYALRQQIEIGKCNISAPWKWDVEARVKYDVWYSLGNMGKLEAMFKYVSALTELMGSEKWLEWDQPSSGAAKGEGGAGEPSEAGGGGGGEEKGGGGGGGGGENPTSHRDGRVSGGGSSNGKQYKPSSIKRNKTMPSSSLSSSSGSSSGTSSSDDGYEDEGSSTSSYSYTYSLSEDRDTLRAIQVLEAKLKQETEARLRLEAEVAALRGEEEGWWTWFLSWVGGIVAPHPAPDHVTGGSPV